MNSVQARKICTLVYRLLLIWSNAQVSIKAKHFDSCNFLHSYLQREKGCSILTNLHLFSSSFAV